MTEPKKCWSCDFEIKPNDMGYARGECMQCFREKDGPYEEDAEES